MVSAPFLASKAPEVFSGAISLDNNGSIESQRWVIVFLIALIYVLAAYFINTSTLVYSICGVSFLLFMGWFLSYLVVKVNYVVL